MGNKSHHYWTAPEIETLKRLRAEGKCRKTIARAIGTVTPEAVKAMIGRLRLPKPIGERVPETVETWVRSQIDSAHSDMWRGGVHGHSYTIWACWNGTPLRDARDFKRRLDEATAVLDHRLLDDVLSDTSGENIARFIGNRLKDCIVVTVERSDFKAVWKKRLQSGRNRSIGREPAKGNVTMIWTKELSAAAIALAADCTPRLHRESLDTDVRSRAREFANVVVGYEFQPFQVEYAHCLLQRLDMDYDNPRPTHTAFRHAWEAALQND